MVIAAMIFASIWIVIVLPWYHSKMRQGASGTRKERRTSIKPKPAVNVPAPIGSWWSRRAIKWF